VSDNLGIDRLILDDDVDELLASEDEDVMAAVEGNRGTGGTWRGAVEVDPVRAHIGVSISRISFTCLCNSAFCATINCKSASWPFCNAFTEFTSSSMRTDK
jgi:hypothetical protein